MIGLECVLVAPVRVTPREVVIGLLVILGGNVRIRIEIRERHADGVQLALRNDVSRELRSRSVGSRAERVVDRLERSAPGLKSAPGQALREVPRPFECRGHGKKTGGAIALAVGLSAEEEERLVSPIVEFRDHDGTAERTRPIAEWLIGDWITGAIREEAVRQPVRLANVADRTAMYVVRSRAQQRVKRAAAGASHLGVIGAGLNLQLLNGFGRGDNHRAIVRIGNGDPIHQVVVSPQRTARDRNLRIAVLVLHAGKLRVGDKHDGLRQFADEEWVSPENRQVRDLLGVDQLPG